MASNRAIKQAAHMRSPADFYATPAWCVELVWPIIAPFYAGLTVLDPCAGDGAILRALPGSTPRCGVELNPRRVLECTRAGIDCLHADYLSETDMPWAGGVGILTNPPYSLVDAFIERSLALCPDAPVTMLLSVGFVGAQKRADLLREPFDLYLLPRRPHFTGSGSAMAGYGWFSWGPHATNTHRML